MNPSLLLLLLLFGVSGILGAQHLPQIYVHTDRSIYTPGDTVWFKAYLMHDGRLDSSIHNLYIDWADGSGRVLESNAYLAADGYSFSQFVIPLDWKSQHLYLNAFTKNIHANPHFGFVKQLDVLQSNNNELFDELRYDMAVKTNGGVLVKGLSNSLSLRSEDSRGLPFLYIAEVLSPDSVVLAQSVSDSSGIASIEFTPDVGPYIIRWTGPSGHAQVKQLPPVISSGVIVQLEQHSSGLVARLVPSADISGTYVLQGRLNQIALFEQPVSLKGKPMNVIIPFDAPHFGLLQLRLEDDHGQERGSLSQIVGVEEVYVEPKIALIQTSPEPRSKQQIDLTLPDVEYANLSISIVDDFVLPDSSDRMMNAILGNQLTNRSTLPAKSLITPWSKTVSWNRDYTVIDTLASLADQPLFVTGQLTMSEKAWKDYDSIQQDENRKSFIPSNSVSVGYRPVRNDTISYPFHYTTTLIDTDRRIMLKELQFFDTMEFRVSHIDRTMQYAELTVNYSFKPFKDHMKQGLPQSYFAPKLLYLDKAISVMKTNDYHRFSNIKTVHRIEAVDVIRQAKPQQVINLENKFDVTERFRKAAKDILPQEDKYVQKYSIGLSEYLQREFNRVSRFVRVYLNELLVVDVVTPYTLSPSRGELWEEALQQDMAGFGLIKVLSGANGDELAVYAFSPNDYNRELGRNITINKVGGYKSIAPVHNKMYLSSDVGGGERDERLTLFWHPLVLWSPKNSNKITFEFSNNDVSKGYWIIVKGITADGRLVDYSKRIELSPKL